MIRQGLDVRRAVPIWLGAGLAILLGIATPLKADQFLVTNLVSDQAGQAQIQDPHLVNSWGISLSGGSPFWISDNGTGLSTLYSVNPSSNATAKQGLEVTIPGDGSVTGQAFNSASATGAFHADNFLFVSEDGTISGWRGALGTTAEVLQLSDPANIYKGVTLDTTGGHSYLLSANFGTGKIDVLKGDTSAPDLAGKFTDPGLPAGYAPFNIALLNGKIYVTYAVQNGKDDLPGAGHGIVSVFNQDGTFVQRLSTGGGLNSPWGMVIAPSSFTSVAGDLLVGNFGDGRINIIDPTSGAQLGFLQDPNHKTISIDGLWGLVQGNGGNGGSTGKIYFSAGPGGEAHGLFGVLESVPEPSSVVLGLIAVGALAGSWQWKKRRRASAA